MYSAISGMSCVQTPIHDAMSCSELACILPLTAARLNCQICDIFLIIEHRLFSSPGRLRCRVAVRSLRIPKRQRAAPRRDFMPRCARPVDDGRDAAISGGIKTPPARIGVPEYRSKTGHVPAGRRTKIMAQKSYLRVAPAALPPAFSN